MRWPADRVGWARTAVLVAVFQSPDSPANTTAQLVTALGWLLSIGMLVAGHLRAEPQRWRLRLWWLAQVGWRAHSARPQRTDPWVNARDGEEQFCFSLVVFVNHSAMHLSSPGLRSIRGLALACVASLAALSLFPEDVPKYQSLTLGEDDEEASPPRAETPLLASSASEQAPMGASMLSQRTLYGASTNEYSAALSAWGSALRRMGSAGGKTGEGGQGGEAAGGGLQEGEGGDN
jgi:hypothetical protein